MSLFDFFKKDKIENENKSKPFHANVNASDRRDWFSRTRPWHKVSPLIIDVLVDKFGGNPMFEVFVITSMTDNLVSNYEALGKAETPLIPDVVCTQISGILYSTGINAFQKFEQLLKIGGSDKKIELSYATAFNCLETAIILSDYMIASYVALAKLKIFAGSPEEAREIIESGLNKIQKLKEHSNELSASSIDSISQAPQAFDEIEQVLLSMKEEI